MYHDFDSVAAYRAALDLAIDSAMQGEVLIDVIDIVHDTIDENVYYSYFPEFHNRRMEAGGLSDKANLSPDYIAGSKTLHIQATAPWQNLGNFHYKDGRGIYNKDLSYVIERKGLYNAPPRPFAQDAEKKLQSGIIDKALQHAIIIRGL